MKNIRTIVIAAAGKGTRLQPVSNTIPKHLLKIAGKPFLWYVLSGAARFGFERMVVVVGHYAHAMKEFLATQPYPIDVVVQSEQVGEKYGTAAVVEAAQQAIGNEPFIFQNGDSLYSPNAMESLLDDDGFSHIVGTHHEDPTHYGVVEADPDGWLIRVVEKPQQPVCHVINIGLYAFQPDVFQAVRTVRLSARGEYELTDALNLLAADRRVKVLQLDGAWVDLGRPEDIPSVERFIAQYQFLHRSV